MKTDDRYRKSITPLLAPGETLVAAPVLASWASGRGAQQTVGRASQAVAGTVMGGSSYESNGVAGALVAALDLADEDVRLPGEMAAATDQRLLFFSPNRMAIRPKVSDVIGEFPIDDVRLSWCDGSLLGVKWRAFCFHLPDGGWWALEANRGSKLRKPPNAEADLMVEAFGDRAAQIATD